MTFAIIIHYIYIIQSLNWNQIMWLIYTWWFMSKCVCCVGNVCSEDSGYAVEWNENVCSQMACVTIWALERPFTTSCSRTQSPTGPHHSTLIYNTQSNVDVHYTHKQRHQQITIPSTCVQKFQKIHLAGLMGVFYYQPVCRTCGKHDFKSHFHACSI